MSANKDQAVEDTHLPVTVLDESNDHEGFRKVVTYRYREDESGLEAKREIVVAQSAVAVIAYDAALEKLVMIRQFRFGAQLTTGRGMSVEVVAGLIDEGEDAESTVIRELKEESGLDAKSIRHCCSFLTTPGMSNEMIHLYFAHVDASELVGEAGEESETEQTFPFLLTLDDAMSAVDENRITNVIAMFALMWFERHQKTLLAGAPS